MTRKDGKRFYFIRDSLNDICKIGHLGKLVFCGLEIPQYWYYFLQRFLLGLICDKNGKKYEFDFCSAFEWKKRNIKSRRKELFFTTEGGYEIQVFTQRSKGSNQINLVYSTQRIWRNT